MLRPPSLDSELVSLGGRPAVLPADFIRVMRSAPPRPAPTDEELTLGGAFTVAEGAEAGVPLLVARPTRVRQARGCVYFMHGGGMVFGDNRRKLGGVLGWAAELDLVVVSAGYRLAPENPHPGPVEDCWQGLTWTAGHAGELTFDPAGLMVAGGSAGGGLAAALALMARDRGGPALRGQLLMGPMLDDRNDSASVTQMAAAGGWDKAANEAGWTALLGAARGGADVSPYAAPARTTDVSGLPPAYVDVGSAEIFRDEAVAYANRIWQAGGSAELHVWPGGFHGFDVHFPQATLSRAAQAARLAWLRRLYATPAAE
ncbi:alpha/beta hydrolase fold domain-containing protein [Symbioplanes lichenis]|uniref:alpha/beta hydrolase fold domain-containing protein n=1 Tax=Symbioplanes lichenis TaxID=1629072 RepID=UPI002739AB35|nr:alpha/beta hydrolase [Actinoplanes lichenis]